MTIPTPHQLTDGVAYTVMVCSLLHTLLPPWDMLSDFPSAQRYYKLVVYIVGYVGLTGRSTVYKSISMSRQAPGIKETFK